MSIETPVEGERNLGDEVLFLFALANNRFQVGKSRFEKMMEQKPKLVQMGCAATVVALLGGGYILLFGTAKDVK